MTKEECTECFNERCDVMYEGLVYTIKSCIVTWIEHPYTKKPTKIFQVELYRGNHSVTIADPRKVTRAPCIQSVYTGK